MACAGVVDTMTPMDARPPFADDLDATRHHVWHQLARAVHDRRSPLHTSMLATVGVDGAPRVRTVVLRGADAQSWRVVVHTDARSPKAEELLREPRVSLAFYDAGASAQIRIEGRATRYTGDDIAAAAWARLPDASRRNYRTTAAPGTPSPIPTDGLPERLFGLDDGIENFMLVEIEIDALEWLLLHPDGQRRARFTRETGSWVVP